MENGGAKRCGRLRVRDPSCDVLLKGMRTVLRKGLDKPRKGVLLDSYISEIVWCEIR